MISYHSSEKKEKSIQIKITCKNISRIYLHEENREMSDHDSNKMTIKSYF